MRCSQALALEASATYSEQGPPCTSSVQHQHSDPEQLSSHGEGETAAFFEITVASAPNLLLLMLGSR